MLVLLGTLSLLVATPASWPAVAPPDPAATAGSALPAPHHGSSERRVESAPSLRIAVANVREGSLVSHPFDRADTSDRKAFARRLLTRRGPVPDVLLLQETLGTARAVAREITAHPAARRAGVRFRVALPTRLVRDRGRCDGPRGTFRLLRSSSILLNAQSVTRVLAAGDVRTWGRWKPPAWRVTGPGGLGCTEHPWVRVVVTSADGRSRVVHAVSAHVAPVGPRLKGRAVRVLARTMDHLGQRWPTDLQVLGGDLNLARCADSALAAERPSCRPRPGHRALVRRGFRDAVLDRHPRGADGVAGLRRRIDYLYSTGTAVAAWHDRCYQAYFVTRWACPPSRVAFAEDAALRRCEARTLSGVATLGRCPQSLRGLYYSDHPLLLATLR